MLGAGTVINPIIKIVTTVAILAAVYFFIVKPTLDTTNNALDKVPDNLPGDLQQTVDDIVNGNNTDSSDHKLRQCLKAAIDSGAGEDVFVRCQDRFGT